MTIAMIIRTIHTRPELDDDDDEMLSSLTSMTVKLLFSGAPAVAIYGKIDIATP
jgi:hypothetical protein